MDRETEFVWTIIGTRLFVQVQIPFYGIKAMALLFPASLFDRKPNARQIIQK